MSHAVTPAELFDTARPYGNTPFLVYVGGRSTARLNHVAVTLDEGSAEVVVTGFGRGISQLLSPDMTLSLLWPPHTDGGFSLIADGNAVLRAPRDDADSDVSECLIFTVTGAVLHRPAPTDGHAAC